MRTSAKAIVTKSRKIHMYSELWHASRVVLQAGVRDPKGSSPQFLSSLVLTAFTFEAYMNHVGPEVFECWNELDRLSPIAKFELLCESLDVCFPKKFQERPLQTIKELFQFRNAMAHGRNEELKMDHGPVSVAEADELLGKKLLAKWEKKIETPQFAHQAREDVEAALGQLHLARPDPKEKLFGYFYAVGSATLV